MRIFDHKLNITDYLMIVATFALIAELFGKLNIGGKVHIELYGVIAGVFLADKLVRVAIRAVGGYRNFRRILLLLTISPVLYSFIDGLATGNRDMVQLAFLGLVAYFLFWIAYAVVEAFIIHGVSAPSSEPSHSVIEMEEAMTTGDTVNMVAGTDSLSGV